MLKALLKKQWLENTAFLLRDKSGKRRSTAALIGFVALLLLGLASVCFLFYMMGEMLSLPLAAQGLDHVYFAFMGTMATAFGIIGGIFMAKTELYEAKDNDLLLSMPIPPRVILFARMLKLYLFTLLFVALVFVPSAIYYMVQVQFSAGILFGCLLALLVMPLGALGICCLLGWLLAVVAAKLPNKNLLTTIFTLAFLVLYFIGYSKINDLLTYVITNGGVVADTMKTWLFPFWELGLACTGDFLAFLFYALIFGGLFAIVAVVISLTYFRLVTANRGGRKAKYVSKQGKQDAPVWSLIKKESMRFTKNPMIAMNCLLGTLFLVILPFVALFAKEFRETIASVGADELFAMLLAVILCALISMNMVSAASVSLEGESLWIIRSLPVSTERVLFAKVAFHWLTTAIPALFASVFFCILFKIGFGFALAVTVVSIVFSAFAALLGLVVNLKMPNLHWTNELQAVKQSMSAVVSMFAEWGITALLVGGYFLFGKYLFAGGYFIVCILLLAAASSLLFVWIMRRGKRIFEEL